MIDGLPHSCRYCANMVCGEFNLCIVSNCHISNKSLPRPNKCIKWQGESLASDTGIEWISLKPRKEVLELCKGQTVMDF